MDIVTGVGVLDKATHVLRAVAERPLSLQGLQAVTDLPRATAHRLAVALEAHGLLRRDEDGRFDLGPELAALGRIASERFPLAGLALPVLEALRQDTGESAQLFVREGTQRRCVLSLQSPHALRWIVPEGVLFPLELGSAGRVLSGETRSEWVESVEEREAGRRVGQRPGDRRRGSDRRRRQRVRTDRPAHPATRRDLRRPGRACSPPDRVAAGNHRLRRCVQQV